MKSKIIFITAIVLLSYSCGLEDLGQSECAISIKKSLDESQEDYENDIYIDEEGKPKEQSYENCWYARERTRDYIAELKIYEDYIATNNCFRDTEVLDIGARIEGKKRDLEEDIEDVWNLCESVYDR